MNKKVEQVHPALLFYSAIISYKSISKKRDCENQNNK